MGVNNTQLTGLDSWIHNLTLNLERIRGGDAIELELICKADLNLGFSYEKNQTIQLNYEAFDRIIYEGVALIQKTPWYNL